MVSALMFLAALMVGGMFVFKRKGPDWRSLGRLALACLPFALVPGASDASYTPIAPNDPFIGGALALLVGWVLLNWQTKFWHILVGVLFTVMVAFSLFAMVGAIPKEVQAILLEVVYCFIMLAFILGRFGILDDFPPPLAVTAKKAEVFLCRVTG